MSKPTKILIVDDEPAIVDMLAFTIEQGGFLSLMAENTQQAHAIIQRNRPDLVLLDWMLPGQSGIEFTKLLRQDASTCDLPIIMVTARDSNLDKAQGLEHGADDYITKPFSPRELLARIQAVLRRVVQLPASKVFEIAGLHLDLESHLVSVNGNTQKLSPTEFSLLHFFMLHPERVYSRNQLIDGVWGKNVCVEERTVDVHVKRLRDVLSVLDHSTLIQTVRGSGYRFSNWTCAQPSRQ